MGLFVEKTFSFYGKLKNMTKAEAENKVKAFGGKILKKVSKNLDYLVAGALKKTRLGDELRKAEKLGIRIIKELDFLSIVEGEKTRFAKFSQTKGTYLTNKRKYPHIYCCGFELELKPGANQDTFIAECFICKKSWTLINLSDKKNLKLNLEDFCRK